MGTPGTPPMLPRTVLRICVIIAEGSDPPPAPVVDDPTDAPGAAPLDAPLSSLMTAGPASLRIPPSKSSTEVCSEYRSAQVWQGMLRGYLNVSFDINELGMAYLDGFLPRIPQGSPVLMGTRMMVENAGDFPSGVL